MLYWQPQKGQLKNPDFSVHCNDWQTVKAKYPYLSDQAEAVKNELASMCLYKVTEDWTAEQPYARICVPVRSRLVLMYKHQHRQSLTHTCYLSFLTHADKGWDEERNQSTGLYHQGESIWTADRFDLNHILQVHN